VKTSTIDDPVYILAFFLNPGYRRVAVSKEIQLKDIKKGIVWIALKWGYSSEQCNRLITQVRDYYENKPPFDQQRYGSDQVEYWTALEQSDKTDILRSIALQLFCIVIQSRGCESLFSMMGYVKTKFRNRMSDSTMEMMAQIKLMLFDDPDTKKMFKNSKLSKQDHLDRDEANSGRAQASVAGTSEYGMMKLFDDFTNSTLSIADLEEVEALAYTLEGNEQDLSVPMRNARIGDLFNFDKAFGDLGEREKIADEYDDKNDVGLSGAGGNIDNFVFE
jgi:hypothetical protein